MKDLQFNLFVFNLLFTHLRSLALFSTLG